MSDTAQPEILSRNTFRAKLMECHENNRADALNCRISIEQHDEAQRDKIAGLESELSTCVAVAQKYEYQLAALRAEVERLKGERDEAKRVLDDAIRQNAAQVDHLTAEMYKAQTSARDSQRLLNEVNHQYVTEVSALRAKLEAAQGERASRMVREFHETYGVPILDRPAFPSHDRCTLRENILEEEWIELCEAQSKRDIVEVADALADMLYIIHGTALEYGIPLDDVVAEVHRSNMSKLGTDGKPIIREDGKVLKGPNYFRPNISGVIDAAMRSLEPPNSPAPL